MAKYHVNDKGESGQCRAEKGGCPFGGEAQHYSSPEIARQAYELSMAGEQIATVKKASSEKVKKAAKSLGETLDELLSRRRTVMDDMPLSREDFDPDLHEGFKYDEVFYDELMRKKDIYNRHARLFPYEPENMDRINEWMRTDFQQWQRNARFEKAKSFEKDVPIRLIPTGGKVEVSMQNAEQYSNRTYRQVGRPVEVEGTGEIVGRYRDSNNEWDYVQPDTTFNTGYIDPEKNLDSHWADENLAAKRLAMVRGAYTETERKLTASNYDSSQWDGVALEDLKFDHQAILDREAANGSSELSAREAAVRAKRYWDSKARTSPAATNEDGVPIRLIPNGAEVAVGSRHADGSIDVGIVLTPVVKDDQLFGRVRYKGNIIELSPGTLHDVGYFDENMSVSPRWKATNERAAKIKEQRERVVSFENGD